MNVFAKYLNATTVSELDAAYDELLEVVAEDVTVPDDGLVDALDNWMRAAGMPSYPQRVSAIKFTLA